MVRRNLLGALAITALVSGCATHYTGDAVQDPYGFLSGVWHGLIFPFALITNLVSWLLGLVGISFFESIQIIGRPNTGFWYYVGFALGLSGSGGGAAR